MREPEPDRHAAVAVVLIVVVLAILIALAALIALGIFDPLRAARELGALRHPPPPAP